MDLVNGRWPRVPLGRLLTRSEEVTDLQPEQLYKQVTVRLWGQGVVLRGEVSGAQIAAARQYLVRPSQFILSRIDARNGALGLVPPILNGAVVSNDFPVFNIDCQQLEPRFLAWLSKTSGFVDLCRAASEGTTNRVRLQVERFLTIEIPLPPLDEQRRIVARIETLAAKVETTLGLRQKAAEEIATLLNTARSHVFQQAAQNGWEIKQLEEVSPINMGQSPPGEFYNQSSVGIPLLNGPTEFGVHHPTAVQWTTMPTKTCKPGDILLCVRGATTGKMNWADREYCIGRGLAALTAKPEICIPEYVYHFVATQTRAMLALSAGSTFPNLPGEKLRKLPIPLPPLPEQRCIVARLDALQAQIAAVQAHQAAASAALEALMPSILDRAFRGKL